jgi:hypothetical protein
VEKVAKNVGYFCHKKYYIPKVNNYLLGENSPNLVTLTLRRERAKDLKK